MGFVHQTFAGPASPASCWCAAPAASRTTGHGALLCQSVLVLCLLWNGMVYSSKQRAAQGESSERQGPRSRPFLSELRSEHRYGRTINSTRSTAVPVPTRTAMAMPTAVLVYYLYMYMY